jgi:hypothetical protein
MGKFSISFNDVINQYNQKGVYDFFHPTLNSNIKVSFQDCNTDVERFVKVIKTIKIYNKKLILIRNDTTNDSIKTTHDKSNYYKNALSLQSLINNK